MIYNFIIKLINSLIRGLGSILTIIFTLLPDSPFKNIPTGISEYLGYINYFIPIADMIVIMTAWLTCIAVHYIYQIVLRWIKVIE